MSRHTQDTTIARLTYPYAPFTLFGRPFQTLPVHRRLNIVVLQPRSCRNMAGLGYYPFARRYSGNRFFFLFLRLLRCFSSAGWLTLLCDSSSNCRVVPFGYLRINSRLQIPVAFRSLPRPSSPPRAKASPERPYSLSFSRIRGPIEATHPFLSYSIMSMNVSFFKNKPQNSGV